MKTESQWELMADSAPSEQFACTYGGSFAQRMFLDRVQIERFLSIAALDGRVLLQESKVRPPRGVPEGINPDGSVTGRGSLRWGQKIENGVGKTQNPYFQVEPDDAGWVVSINGSLIMDGLMEKGLSAREVERNTIKKINYYTRIGLREALLKDKCTEEKDSNLRYKIIGSTLLLYVYSIAIFYPNFWSYTFAGLTAFFNHGINFLLKKSEENLGTYDPRISPKQWESFTYKEANKWVKYLGNYCRRTMVSDLDCFGLPFQLFDRVALAYGYMDWKKYTGNPLVRAAD